MAKASYQSDVQDALTREVERLNEEIGDNRPKLSKSAPLTGDLAKLVERVQFLEDL